MSDSKLVVLYAEDAEDDAFLMQRAFAKVKFPGSLVVVPHGLAATEYLEGAGRFASRETHPLPCLILLDIKMPHLGGLEVLRWIRERETFRDTPVLMLTSSSQESDIATAYASGADCYLVKPANLDTFRELVEDLAVICAKREPRLGSLHVRGAVLAPTAN